MKLAVVFLCLLGVGAAACAAFLVNGLNATMGTSKPSTTQPAENPNVEVLYVTRQVPAMSVIDGGMVVSRTVPRNEAPVGYISAATDVVGRIVSQPMAGGQVFTKTCFAEMTGPRQLAGIIPKGKRAVGISVTDYAGLEGLIYPGSMVDVMVSFKADGSADSHREAVTTTLIENVQVLAFEQQTVVSPGRTLAEIDTPHSGPTRRVTLLVDTKQSKALELGMEQGTLSLALRNPLDSTDADKEAVSVHSLMGEEPPIGARLPSPELNKAWESALHMAMSVFHKDQVTAPAATQPAAPPPPPHWDTTIIRGQQIETRSFPLPAATDAKPDMTKATPVPLSVGSSGQN